MLIGGSWDEEGGASRFSPKVYEREFVRAT
jgi:hypothetical protein